MRKRNNKFLAIGLATVGVIGAGSVAFATWLVGVQQTERQVELDVLVDDTQDVNISLTAQLSSQILNIEDTTSFDNTNGNAMIGTADISSAPSALKFGFSELKLVIGQDVTKQFQSITVTCAELYPLTSTGINKIQVKESKESDLVNKRNTAEGLKYIDFTTITLNADDFNVSGKTYTLKTEAATTDKFKFAFGDYFDGKSPVNYYNDIYANKSGEGSTWSGLKRNIYSNTELETQHTHIIDELRAMKNHFENKTLTLTVKANFIN